MLRGPRGLIVTLLGAAVIIAAAIYFGFQDQKDDAETSRAFLTHAAAGEMAEAYALLHPGVTQSYSLADVSAMLVGMEPFTDISFPGISFSYGVGPRTTELTGTGSTGSGCESALQFELFEGEITFFDISPVCRGQGGSGT